MKGSTLISAFFLMLLFVAGGCKAKKVIVGVKPTAEISADLLLDLINGSNLRFEFLEAEGIAKVNTDGMSVTGNFQMRLEKDNRAWIRVQKFGFEAARILVENDTLILLNRLNKTYQKFSIEESQKLTGLSLTQKDFVNLLAGHSLTDGSEFISVTRDSSAYIYKTAFDDFFANYRIDEVVKTVEQAMFIDLENREVTADYSEYNTVGEDQKFAHNRVYQVEDPKMGNAFIELKFKEVLMPTSLNFPFEIPSHYTRQY